MFFFDKYLDTIIANSIFLAFFGMAARSYQAVMSYQSFTTPKPQS